MAQDDDDVRGRSARAAWICLSDAVELLERAGMPSLGASCHRLLERLEECMDEAQLMAIREGIVAAPGDQPRARPARDLDEDPTWPRRADSRTL